LGNLKNGSKNQSPQYEWEKRVSLKNRTTFRSEISVLITDSYDVFLYLTN